MSKTKKGSSKPPTNPTKPVVVSAVTKAPSKADPSKKKSQRGDLPGSWGFGTGDFNAWGQQASSYDSGGSGMGRKTVTKKKGKKVVIKKKGKKKKRKY